MGADEARGPGQAPGRLRALGSTKYRRAKSDVLDYEAMRRALRDREILFHLAGSVASSPVEQVWELNAQGPVVAVEA
jgi:hypothetical protein